MSEPFIAEIRMFGFNFAPQNWAQCNGQLLPIMQNTALFSLVGTMYGGDGKTTFALPNLQDAVPVAADTTDLVPGATGGVETVTLTESQLPAHSHAANCSSAAGNAYGPPGNIWAEDAAGVNEYGPASTTAMNSGAISPAGGGQSHNNLQPFVVLNYCIALTGVFPPRS
ncbi:MAG: phage tail protein [Bryobacterales bacterium]|nr:phage tail protein [Bryobacterales bacterium]